MPLPEPHTLDFAPDAAPLYTADQLRAYADARVSAETAALRKSVDICLSAARQAAAERDEARAEAERLRAFRDFFRDRCEVLFSNFGMEAVDLYNASGPLGRAAILADRGGDK